MVGPAIDNLVTPKGVRAALMAKRDEELTGTTSLASSALRVPNDPVIERRGFSEFFVTSKRRPTSGLVFKRHGLSWKLSGVELPPAGWSQLRRLTCFGFHPLVKTRLGLF